ncbi:hypothetical protein H310_01932 [Aphanomyces invadans]|uniref:OsmC-like protein n=1 Tax=Aphanomyces invadans TaxID=157072 RepID=A0A024UMB6_9STRA|nr:hypothetical protein H310_01932 [Aphanomyces invadans]ETW07409.1 hypothetical protein H310_01932 [Aphanomyces invadans]|eukprot:XP_008863502.1 hypothetical protein H310_01932 [Aphanomyces invadans]
MLCRRGARWRGVGPGRCLTSKACMSYHLVGHGEGVKCTMKRPDGISISTDIPKAMGGSNTAPQPVELFLTSLCGCELATAQFVARHMTPRMTIEKIEFNVQASRKKQGALHLPLGNHDDAPLARPDRIWGQALVYTSATQKQVDQLAAEVKTRCPIANMTVLSGCVLDIEWIARRVVE